jgi:hypothetical protein
MKLALILNHKQVIDVLVAGGSFLSCVVGALVAKFGFRRGKELEQT